MWGNQKRVYQLKASKQLKEKDNEKERERVERKSTEEMGRNKGRRCENTIQSTFDSNIIGGES